MKDRRKEIRNRIAKRKKMSGTRPSGFTPPIYDEEKYGFERLPAYEGTPSDLDHPLFKKEVFYFKILAALCLFLITAVLFKHPSEKLDAARNFVSNTMETEMQFAAISNWYEETFGKPIAFLPPDTGKSEQAEKTIANTEYALPASGRIMEPFEVNGEGIMIETGLGSKVEAVNEGIVIFAGVKEQLGKTVIIQHYDKSESWYGGLERVDVLLYDPVSKGKSIGTVAPSEDASKGSFYLAIKKDDIFIDPNKVISFE
ncbi:M23 family peptidase [Peribacillus saganii]|uniref:M23 family peptidase n=1 Tax=Peribacillus saganii TaxID=2303992 RepID=A0A372LU46_9BACI|nr:M23 family metallopeptidase [Peribacillus saganii]RFU71586.1 M23 family peptidase [Peribacillus saganii]